MTNLMIINGSIRDGRIGGPIGEWVKRAAEADGRFTVDYADLAEIDLPMMNEPNHPRLKKYLHEHTVAWSNRVEAADGFVFLFPEYNHSFSAPIKNAVDYLHNEWNRKPLGLVNWGGNSGGTRAQAAFKPVAVCVGLVPTKGSIEINFPQRQLNDNGEFEPNEQQRTVLGLQFDEIVKLSGVLAPLR